MHRSPQAWRELHDEIDALAGEGGRSAPTGRSRNDCAFTPLPRTSSSARGAIGELLDREPFDGVARSRGVDDVAHELGVGVEAGERDTVAGEHDRGGLEVVADLAHARVFEQPAQRGWQHGRLRRGRRCIVGDREEVRGRRTRRGVAGADERNVARDAGLVAERDAHQRRAHGRRIVEHDVERDVAGLLAPGDECVDCRGVFEDGVVAGDRVAPSPRSARTR